MMTLNIGEDFRTNLKQLFMRMKLIQKLINLLSIILSGKFDFIIDIQTVTKLGKL